ncbi:ATP-dependent Clp protease ATP-binding subunit [Prevotella sp. P3-122]|uniref:ATP-dependent Clp protease ATP-binding subunit n=1 Tax=Prevotella sp. P3-122 TaxID=2024223 RepID=UPI000B966746|nr:ATP-dependent Clp protease ATP-binding subunit [Prevotella sp. P3-122]OYP57855.1 Clp protease ClpC [Prevotella sp. P3-122]
MTSQFSPKVSEILAYSREEATRLASRSVGPEHLLLGIIRDRKSNVCDVLRRMAINTDIIKAELEDRVREDNYSQPLITTELVLNDKASNILKLAVLEARVQHTQTVDVEHLLLAMLHDKSDNGAKIVLESNNITYDDALAYLHKTSKPNDGIGLSDDEFEDEMDDNTVDNKNQNKDHMATATKKPAGKTPVLDNFSTDLTQAALEGKLDPVVGRTAEIARMMEILCRRKKNNPILIGEPGVGKSAIVEGLAQLIAHHRTSPILFGKRVVSLDMTAMVAGTKYRGQFEERIKTLLRELEQNPDIIVFIDEIHTMIGAGSTPGSMDAANIMKPALARGTIQCIGATTIDEYRKSIEKDGALERRFQKVLVEPTSETETLDILRNIKDRYEEHHHVNYTDEALSACVKLTGRYVNDRHFPDKAIDALDEVGAKIHLLHAEVPVEIRDKEKEIEQMKAKKQAAVKNQNFELAAGFRDRQTELEAELAEMNRKWTSGDGATRITVTDADVANVVAMMSGVPVQKIAEAEGSQLRHMAQELKNRIVAQDAAIDKVVKSIQRNRVGLKDPNHPIGAFMFLGPTGVGKTYLAKQLAIMMFGREDALIRIDMSEYSESFNTSRLVGAPPGYVGYEEGGQLTERVRRHPYSIVLLDEIEKAHGNVFNMLLQVLDEGRLTDGNGRLVDFRNTIIIMTSNAGTRQLKEFGKGVGFNAGTTMGLSLDDKDKEYARSIIQKSLSKQFSPEFLNRLDDIITFDQLDIQAIKTIIDLELSGLFGRMEQMGYKLNISDEAKEMVATKGYDVQFGARPLKRAIQTYIEEGLCEMMLNGEAHPGDTITIGKEEGQEKLKFEITA